MTTVQEAMKDEEMPQGVRKSLRAIKAASKGYSGTVVPTFLGAHVVPKEFQSKRKDYVDARGQAWRPATEWVTRLGFGVDTVARCWWGTAAATIPCCNTI